MMAAPAPKVGGFGVGRWSNISEGELRLNSIKSSAKQILEIPVIPIEVPEFAMFFVCNLVPTSQAECRRFDPDLPLQQNKRVIYRIAKFQDPTILTGLGLREHDPFQDHEAHHKGTEAAKSWVHTLRHSYRSWLGNTDAKLAQMKDLMRHSGAATTMMYGRTPVDEMRPLREAVASRLKVAKGKSVGPAQPLVDASAAEPP